MGASDTEDGDGSSVVLDAWHHHEIVDRLHCVVDRISCDVLSHPVCQQHPGLQRMVDEAVEKLSDAYQLANTLDENLGVQGDGR